MSLAKARPGLTVAVALLAFANTAVARVTRIVVDSTTPLSGQNGAYEQVRGRAFGELDPGDSHNAIITDIGLGKSADGKVRYETTFVLTEPIDMAGASGFMWHEVPNRPEMTLVGVPRRRDAVLDR